MFPTEKQNIQFRLWAELDQIRRQARHPINFARKGELPHSDHVGWTWRTAWFYASREVQLACYQRRHAALCRADEIIAALRRNY